MKSPLMRGLSFPLQGTLTIPQLELPDGQFLLPVCTTRDRLHKTLSVLWEGRFLIPDDPHNPELEGQPHNLDHMHDILEALAFVNHPQDVPCAEIDNCDDGCRSHLPNSGLISYEPNDPFRTPQVTPDGYNRPPWYTNPSIPFPGVLPSDAMVDFASVPGIFILLQSGYPRFRVEVVGTGQIEIEFVQVPQGGLVLITWDDDPLTAEFMDLTSMGLTEVASLGFILAALGIETDAQAVNTVVWEHEFSDFGTHHVDVTFLPNFSLSDEILVGFGGGIRRVDLCGLSVPETGVESMELRLTDGCILEFRLGEAGEWTPVQGWTANALSCFGQEVTPPEAPGEENNSLTTGIDRTGNDLKCRVASALIKGFWEDWLNPVLGAVIAGLEGEVELPGIIVLAKEKWFGTVYTAEEQFVFNSWIEGLTMSDSPDGNLYQIQQGLSTDALHDRLRAAIYAWSSPSGGLDLHSIFTFQHITQLNDALLSKLGLDYGYISVWGEALTIAFTQEVDLFGEWLAGRIATTQSDCNDLDLIPWISIIGEYTHLFDFAQGQQGWTNGDTLGITSHYVPFQGWTPDAANEINSCLDIQSIEVATRLKAITVHLDPPTNYDTLMTIATRHTDTGNWISQGVYHTFGVVEMTVSNLSPDDEIDRIAVYFQHSTEACSIVPTDPRPVLDWISVTGVGLDPY